jgi:hypothetical protein
MENFEKWSYSRSESFSTMLPLASLQTQNSSAGGRWRTQTVAFAVAQLRGHGARKSIQFALHKPLFQLGRGKGGKKYFVTILPEMLYIVINRFQDKIWKSSPI